MPYYNFHSARIRDPKDFKEDSFRTIHGGKHVFPGAGMIEVPKNIEVITGQLMEQEGVERAPESLHFPKDDFTPEQAKEWLKDYSIDYILFEPAEDEPEEEDEEAEKNKVKQHPPRKKILPPLTKVDEDDEEEEYKALEGEKIALNIERRDFKLDKIKVEKRTEEGTEKNYIVGHASIFNELSQDLGGFKEKISPQAFDEVLTDDCRCLINHDANLILGRTRAGTMNLAVDERGLRYEVQIPETTYGKDLLISMQRKDITQSSFGFIVEEDTWTEDRSEGGMIRTINKVGRLLDTSVVTYPAYLGADVVVAQRSLSLYKEKQENMKEQQDLHKRSLLNLKIKILKSKK